MKNIIYAGAENSLNNNEIIAFILSNDIHLFTFIFIFAILGGAIRDYLDTVSGGEVKIKLLTIILSSFFIAWAIFSQMYRIENLKFVLLLSYIGGFSYYTINNLLISFSNDKRLFKKILLKMLSGISSLSDILKDDNKDE